MKIAYLIPYYNAYDDLILTLASLTEGIDVVIVDDGSVTPLMDIFDVSAYAYPIHIITAPRNLGIEGALNLGLNAMYGQYTHVARIDCGDLSAPDRIKIQSAYVNQHPDVIMVGAWARFVDSDYQPLFISEMPTTYADIQQQMMINNMFVHPSVMMKLSAVEALGGYPTHRPAAEDYALFYDLLETGPCVNLAEPLIDYVVSQTSISSNKRTRQIISRMQVMWDHKRWHWRWGYGLCRSVMLLIVPRGVTTMLRKFIKVY
mgnify:CR=1 FL=1